ncbi:MAG: AAA family ATPase [Polyangiaceae bacterium]|nr:AAA family ATPase [Polyangiaceae bacterium]
MIDRVHFENFKSLKDVALDLGRLTVLVGANGCGKSSVLQGMDLLARTVVHVPGEETWVQGRFAVIFRGARDAGRLASPGRPTTMKLAMRHAAGDELELQVDVPPPSGGDPENEKREYRVTVTDGAGSYMVRKPGPDAFPDAMDVLQGARVRSFASVTYLNLDAQQMTETSVPDAERPRMASNGSQLASVLAFMKGAAEEDLGRVTGDLGRVVPGAKRIRTLRERVKRSRMERLSIDGQPVWRPVEETLLGDRFELEFDDGNSVPADLLSEGTVLALGLLTKLHEPERPRVLLLDDIDRGLHIEAQARLVQVLRDLLALDPELQIVCTTHSPYLLDRFEPSEVRVLALDPERHTHALPLTEHPEFNRWKHGVQTGELWASLGDAWVAPRDPEPKEQEG